MQVGTCPVNILSRHNPKWIKSMDHPLENLGPERFQHLCQALLVKEFPGVTFFPVGQPDGGRDAIQWQLGQRQGDDEALNAQIFQIKFARHPPEDIDAWVVSAATGELAKVERLKSRGAKSYVFISNVVGTAHLDVGSIDRLQKRLADIFKLPVICWWRDDINRRLDGNWDIKLRYPETLSGQDFFRLLLETSSNSGHSARTNALKAFIAEQYREDEEVKFKQVELQNKLLDLFVDLPYRVHFKKLPKSFSGSGNALGIQMRANGDGVILTDEHDEVGGPGGTATLLLRYFDGHPFGQVVIEGAPGQGKSTLVQYLCQVHRIRLLGRQVDFLRLPEHHRNSPLYLPFKVDLRDLSEWLAGNDPFAARKGTALPGGEAKTLETFLAFLVTHKSGGMIFEVNDLVESSRLNPLFIALDGLDEVADIKRRAEVVAAVTKGATRLRENCRDLKIIVTSRPAAFANSPGFDTTAFPHIQLGSVKRAQITEYANLWLNARGLLKTERQDFDRILNEKMDQPHLRDLARNPMQLTILLSLILTRGPALPDKRTTLYDQYVDLFFSRESTKNPVVRRHLELLKDIHRFLAWKLHTAAEQGRGTAAGRFDAEELRTVLRQYLEQEGQDTNIVDEVFNAMLERVVMLVSRIEGTFEFEVQPLREYFAARYLYDTASYSPPGGERMGTKPDRFDAVARNFYWLNVARFLCGCFSKGELLDLADRVKSLIAEGDLAVTRHPVTLATMLLRDWVFSQSQKALGEIAAILSDRVYLYKILAPTRYRRDESITIPFESGGREILQSARLWITSADIKTDLIARLGTYICANSESTENANWWMRSRGQVRGLSTWLSIGGTTGALNAAPISQITEILKEDELDMASISVLWSHGLIEAVLTSPVRVAQVERFMLDVPSWCPENMLTTPLHMVPLIISHVNFLMDRIEYGNLVGSIAEYKKVQGDIAFALEDAPYFELEKKCRAFSNFVLERFSEEAEFYSQIFWEPILERARETFGDSIGIYMLANKIAGFRRGISGRIPAAALYDDSQSLISRLRYAKSKAKNGDWWLANLKSAACTNDKLLWSLAFWTWVPPSSVLEIQDSLGHLLDGLDLEEWKKLATVTVANLRSESTRSRSRRLTSPIVKSARLAFLLAQLDYVAFGLDTFLTHFVDTRVHFYGLNRFRQIAAFDAAIREKLDWKTALSVIEESYSRGESYGVRNYHQLEGAQPTIPADVVQEILSEKRFFPCELIDMAIGIRTKSILRDVKQVGRVAKKERWFDQD